MTWDEFKAAVDDQLSALGLDGAAAIGLIDFDFDNPNLSSVCVELVRDYDEDSGRQVKYIQVTEDYNS